MKILCLGSIQAHGPGLPTGKSYLAQLARRLRGDGQPVEIDVYPLDLAGGIPLVPRLHLVTYDLILIQLDLPDHPPQPTGLLRLVGQYWPGAVLNREEWRQWRQRMETVLLQVRVCHRQVVLLSPLPCRRQQNRHVGKLVATICREEARHWQIPFFDAGGCLTGGDELFQTGSDDRLSAVAHELLGSELHTFITEQTYTLWS